MFAGSNPALGTEQEGQGLRNGAVRKLVKRRSSNLRDRLWVRLPPVLLKQLASVGYWQAPVAVTHSLSSFAGSTPARRTFDTR
jgi:hypothetical protein